MLKCSRCRHIFPAERTQRAAAVAPPPSDPPPRAEQKRDLDLAFDETEWEGERGELSIASDEEEFSLDPVAEPSRSGRDASNRREPRLLSETDSPAASRAGSPAREAPARPPAEGTYSFDEEVLEAEGEPEAEEEDEEGRADPDEEEEDEEDEDGDEDDDGDDEDEEEDEVKRGSGSAWGLSLLMFFAVVVAGYFLLAQQLISDRTFAEEFVERLPMVGTSLAADRLLFRKVALSDIEGSFVRVKQGKDVFVISGSALNTASRPLRNIRLESTLSDASAQPLQQETITLGGMDARRLLQGLSLREVEMLGKVEPSRKFTLEPGETTTFAIVFTNPPAGAADFTARVESAQR